MQQGSVNLQTVIDLVRETRSVRYSDPFVPFQGARTLLGMQIVETPVTAEPRLKLSIEAPVTAKFRIEFDAWLVEMFGMRDTSPLPRGTAFVFDKTVLLRKDDRALLNCMV